MDAAVPGIIDSHVHAYPPEILADPQGWAQAQGERHWANLTLKGPQGWASLPEMLRAMDAAGVERCLLQGWYWEHQASCRLHNAWHLQCLREAPERFWAFATVQPTEAGAFDDLRRAIEAGCCGVGELLPAAQGFDIRQHDGWLAICTWLQEQRLPLTLHVTEPAGHEYPGRVLTQLEDYLWLARQFPYLTLILAHWGGGLPFFALNPRVRRDLGNVYYDTAASPLLYEPRVWRTVADLVGADRILFGSDYPLRVYPRQQAEPDFTRLLAEVQGADLSEAERTAILGGNIRRLLSGGRKAETSPA